MSRIVDNRYSKLNFRMSMGGGSTENYVLGIPPTEVGHIARWNDTEGKQIKNSPIYLDGTGNMSLNADRIITVEGTTIVVGVDTLSSQTSLNQDNVGLGKGVMPNLTDGTGNVAIGDGAMENSAVASLNVVIGARAGQNVESSYNVIMGRDAGNTLVSGTGNVIIGADADVSAPDISHAIVIGGIATTSGQLVIKSYPGMDNSGIVTLVGGTATVATAAVDAQTYIFYTRRNCSAPADMGELYLTAVTAGVGFTINSTNPLDTSELNWWMIRMSN